MHLIKRWLIKNGITRFICPQEDPARRLQTAERRKRNEKGKQNEVREGKNPAVIGWAQFN